MKRGIFGTVFLCVVLAVPLPCGAVPPTAQDAGAWLQQRAHQLIRSSVCTMADGTKAFPPQAGCGYDAFWLRDYAYLLEGCSEVFTKQELRDACLTFVNALDDNGAGVDCVRFDGSPIYKPGYGTMGENPVADGSQFTVDVAWRTHRELKDAALLNQIIDPLVKTMNAAPRNPDTGLIYIDPEKKWDRCPYGFTDSIRKQGYELFSSLLYIRASRQLADLLREAGRTEEAARWLAVADAATAAVRDTFWDVEVGLFRATTVQCTEPDIWGSAFAVQLGVATLQQAAAVAQYLKVNYRDIVRAGQIRHLPGGMYWQTTNSAPDSYQNGGYWGVATGWIVETLHLVDPQLAEQTVIDIVDNYQQCGVYEWVNAGGESAGARNYTSSATLPLASIRKLYKVPAPALLLRDVGGNALEGNVAAAVNGGLAFAKDTISGYANHQVACLNDGEYGNDNSWIAGSDKSFVGVVFDKAYTIGALAVGRDNQSSYDDRYQGVYTFQYTTVENPGPLTPESEWTTFGEIDARFQDGYGHLRHYYEFDPISGVTAVRVLIEAAVPGEAGWIGIDEFEVYSVSVSMTKTILDADLLH